jgi:uncharacterized protein YbaA (DUF1428 family)
MNEYVDAFVVPVPKGNADAYRQLEELARDLWIEHGALSYFVAMADDVKPGKWTSFPQSVDLKDDETVACAWITYKSREHRDEVNKKVMADPRFKDHDPSKMPFDGKRMIYGGFKVFVQN